MPTRKALIVAIDDYGSPQNNLSSCIADARAWEAKLRDDFGFEEINVLLDGNATTRNVEGALDALFEDVQPDDRVVVVYSGHGFQTQNGEIREEVLVLRDGFFPDDALSRKSQRLPPGTLTVVLDSCFSGGMEKLIPVEDGFEVAKAKRWIPEDKTIIDQQEQLKAVKRIKLRPFGSARPETPSKLAKDFGGVAGIMPSDETGQLALNGLLISACLENETAAARTEKTKGLSAFTFAAMEVLRRPRHELERGPAVRQIVTQAAQCLHQLGFRQTPLFKEPTRPSGLADRSFLLFNRSAHGMEGIFEAVLNAMREGRPMTTMGTQGFGMGFDPTGMQFGGMGGGMQGMFGGMGMGGQPEKLIGAVVGTLAQAAPHVLPTVLQALRREYESQPWGQQAYGGGHEKLFGSIFPIIAQAAPHVLPMVLQALRKEYEPQWGQQAWGGGQEKLFGSIVPMIAQTAPHVLPMVLQALRREHEPQQQWGQQAYGGGQEKIFGSIFPIIAQAAPHVLPMVLQALRKEYEPQQWGQQQPYGGYGGGMGMGMGGMGGMGMGGEEKGMGDLFRLIAQQAPQVLPQVLQALQQRGGQSFGMGNGISRH